MENKLLIVTLFALFTTCSANAWTESTDGEFTGELNFNGFIISNNSVWEWEIPELSIIAAQDWTSTIESGIKVDLNTHFDYSSKGSFMILDGRTRVPFMGQVGLSPVVTIGGVLINDNQSPQSFVNIEGGGQFYFTLHASSSIAYTIIGGGSIKEYLLATGPRIENKTFEYSVTKNAYPEGFNLIDNNVDYSSITRAYLDINRTNVVGMLDVIISDVKLIFSSDAIPSTWNALLPITVSTR